MPRIRFTALLLGITIILVYVAELLIPGLAAQYGFVATAVLQRPWTLLTSIFLHNPGDYMHLLNNLFFLGVFGFILEQIIGSKRFLALYLSGGIAANLVAFAFYPTTLVLGASGAISVIIAALAVLRPRQVGLLWGVPAPMWAVLLGWTGFNSLGAAATGGNIAFEAHLAGLAYGAVAGYYLRQTVPQRSSPGGQEDDVEIDVEQWERDFMEK